MDFDLSQLDGERTRWIRVGLGDMEIEIRRVGPAERDRHHAKMVRDGVMRPAEKGGGVNPGREMAFYKAMSETYVTGWRNVRMGGEEHVPFTHDRMGIALSQSTALVQALTAAVAEEADFFDAIGSESAA
jgi:hypothetical protein